MSSRLEMLQVARLAPRLLGDAAESVKGFLLEQFNDDGGAKDRAGDSDLYYTVFAVEALIALQAEIPTARVTSYLESFENLAELDLVHTACLARVWASMPHSSFRADVADGIRRHLATFGVSAGFGPVAGANDATIYHTFLGAAALEDLGRMPDDRDGLAEIVRARRAGDGGYANMAGLPSGMTTVTAAAVALLRMAARPIPPEIAAWLLARVHPEGGFLASATAPMPDLLSTATALHALAMTETDISPIKEACLDFTDTLWTGQAFCGHWADDVQDAEYTYYALLALGHLSL